MKRLLFVVWMVLWAVSASAQRTVTADKFELTTVPCHITSGTAAPTGGVTCDIYVKSDGTLWQLAGGVWTKVLDPTVWQAYVQSRAQNLVTNGSGLLGNSTNFSTFTFDQVETYGGGGSFKLTGQVARYADEYIPVDPSRYYKLATWAKTTTLDPGKANFLFGVACYDIDSALISPQYTMFIAGSHTTLASQLKPGDTTVTIASATNWYNGSDANQRNIIVWGYKNSKGYQYANYTYSRYSTVGVSPYGITGAWAQGGITGTTITLAGAWPAALGNPDDPVNHAWPVGTPVSDNLSGGSFKYIAATGGQLPTTWTYYSGYVGSVDLTGGNVTTAFQPGTAYTRIVFLPNYSSGSVNVSNFSNTWFSEFTAFNLEAASTTLSGVVTTGTQTLGGSKAFVSGTTTEDAILTFNDTPSFSFGTSTLQLASGAAATAPNGMWLQGRSSSNAAVPLLFNPAGGNVGVGLLNPTYKFDVSGAGRFTVTGASQLQLAYDGTHVTDLLTGSDGTVYVKPTTGTAYLATASIANHFYVMNYANTWWSHLSGTALSFINGNDSTTGALIDGAGAGYFMGGNIGLGTRTPTLFKLQSAGDIGPDATYSYNLGSLSKKWLTLYASELTVNTLVAQNTMATIGGRILVGQTSPLAADLAPADTTIHVKYNNLTNGDRVVMEGAGNIEFMAITSTAGGSAGNYTYTVTRNLDGSGANQWYAGDAVFDTGQTGGGFIDIYSVAGLNVAGAHGPTLVGNIRNSATFDDWSPRWSLGNLYGLYDYGTNNVYGFAAGDYTHTWLSADATNGFRIKNGATSIMSVDTSGNAVYTGSLVVGSTNKLWVNDAGDGGIALGGSTKASAPFRVTSAGALTATSGTVGGFTITANELYAGTGATRVEMQAAGGFWAGATALADAPFSVTPAGAVKATNATVGAGNLTLDSSGIRITPSTSITADRIYGFTSHTAGLGYTFIAPSQVGAPTISYIQNDCTGHSTGTFYYAIRAYNEQGLATVSASTSGVGPVAPDSECYQQIDWNHVPGADGYLLYRDTTGTPTNYKNVNFVNTFNITTVTGFGSGTFTPPTGTGDQILNIVGDGNLGVRFTGIANPLFGADAMSWYLDSGHFYSTAGTYRELGDAAYPFTKVYANLPQNPGGAKAVVLWDSATKQLYRGASTTGSEPDPEAIANLQQQVNDLQAQVAELRAALARLLGRQ